MVLPRTVTFVTSILGGCVFTWQTYTPWSSLRTPEMANLQLFGYWKLTLYLESDVWVALPRVRSRSDAQSLLRRSHITCGIGDIYRSFEFIQDAIIMIDVSGEWRVHVIYIFKYIINQSNINRVADSLTSTCLPESIATRQSRRAVDPRCNVTFCGSLIPWPSAFSKYGSQSVTRWCLKRGIRRGGRLAIISSETYR